ncbi:MAG: mycothiol transferase [Acidimicrobiia bacterium]
MSLETLDVPFPPPGPVPASADERELLLSFLRHQRELVVSTAVGLTEEQARWQPDGRLIPIIGIVNHLTHVEWRWIDGGMRGERTSRSEAEFSQTSQSQDDGCFYARRGM